MSDVSRALPLLGADEVAELRAWELRYSAEDTSNLAEVLASWSMHVQRFEDELDKTLEDHTVWIEYDWLSAQYARNALASALDGAPERLRRIAQPSVAAVDAQFERISEVDDAGLLKRMHNSDPTGDGWWWNRVPIRGPVVDALLELPEPPS